MLLKDMQVVTVLAQGSTHASSTPRAQDLRASPGSARRPAAAPDLETGMQAGTLQSMHSLSYLDPGAALLSLAHAQRPLFNQETRDKRQSCSWKVPRRQVQQDSRSTSFTCLIGGKRINVEPAQQVHKRKSDNLQKPRRQALRELGCLRSTTCL